VPSPTELLGKKELLEKVIAAIKGCGWQYLILSTSHPFRLRVFQDHEAYTVRIYIWNMTHGGGKARPPDEFRIQITKVEQFEEEPGPEGRTLILGWWDPVGVFAGFDYRKHTGKISHSPSMQIREPFLLEANASRGLSPCNKGNQEIAIAFHPEFIIEYIRSLEQLHDVGKVREDFEILKAVAVDPAAVTDTDINKVTGPRRRAIQSVIRTLRDSSFRDRVLTVYSHRCAMCGLQLELVEAAHIVPVSESTSTDETANGLALCTLHHRAYDKALVTVANDYHVLFSSTEKGRLKKIGFDGRMNAFVNDLRPVICLPPDVKDRPKVSYLQRGREIRHWAD
jgi:putative restriction endonuclease